MKLKLTLLIAILSIPGQASAQPAAEGPEVPSPLRISGRDSTPPVTPVRGSFQSVLTSLFASAGTGTEEVTLNTGFRLFGRTATFTATAPLAEDGPTTELTNVGGLNAGTTLTLAWGGHTQWDTVSAAERKAWCLSVPAEVRRDVDADCDRPRSYGSVGGRKKAWPEPITETFPSSTYFLWQLTGELGYDKLKFLNATTYEPGSHERYSGSAGLNLGRLRRGLLLAVGGRYEGSWDEADAAMICVPVGGDGATQCRTDPLGEPTWEREFVLTAQARRYIRSRIAIQTMLDYMPVSGGWAAKTPIYFAADSEGGLIGGVAPAYDFKENELTISVFIGRAFGLGF